MHPRLAQAELRIKYAVKCLRITVVSFQEGGGRCQFFFQCMGRVSLRFMSRELDETEELCLVDNDYSVTITTLANVCTVITALLYRRTVSTTPNVVMR